MHNGLCIVARLNENIIHFISIIMCQRLFFTPNDKYANALLVVVSLDRGRAGQCCYFLVSSHMWFPPATTLRLAEVIKAEWVIKKQE